MHPDTLIAGAHQGPSQHYSPVNADELFDFYKNTTALHYQHDINSINMIALCSLIAYSGILSDHAHRHAVHHICVINHSLNKRAGLA